MIFIASLAIPIIGIAFTASTRERGDDVHWGKCLSSDELCMAICPTCGEKLMAFDGRNGIGEITKCPECGYVPF